MSTFPRYLLVVEGEERYLTMSEATALFNQFQPVEIDGRVQEVDGSTRRITEIEEGLIRWGRAE